jgi:hypothetical protein
MEGMLFDVSQTRLMLEIFVSEKGKVALPTSTVPWETSVVKASNYHDIIRIKLEFFDRHALQTLL